MATIRFRWRLLRSSKPRRRGAESSETRSALIDAAERLILEEGCAAVTTRRLASKANLKSQLVHYYFKSLDDVFVAVIRRRATRNLQRTAEMDTVDPPFAALWDGNRDKDAASFWLELLALANHRKVIRDEVRHYMEQRRILQATTLERGLKVTASTPMLRRSHGLCSLAASPRFSPSSRCWDSFLDMRRPRNSCRKSSRAPA